MGTRGRKAPKKLKAERTNQTTGLPSRLMTEKVMRDIHKLLQEGEFENTEEANAYLATLTGKGLEKAMRSAPQPSAQEEAQDLAWRAMEAGTAKQARALAKQALAKDPDCVDALMALTAAEAGSPEEAIAGMEKAVAAGERSLGTAFFRENKGAFWGLLETRPYMRARQELADLLLDAGRRSEAVVHYEALLELNPNDNQGVREVLLGCYLAEENLEGARRLLRQYKEDGRAVFAWGRTLTSFLVGDLEAAQRDLKRARRQNHFVELYLTGEILPPDELPETYSLGSKEEAILCVIALADAWAGHPPAMVWIWEQMGFVPEGNYTAQERLF